MSQSVPFGSLAHGESLIINRFAVLPSFITMLHTSIYFSRLSQLCASYLWNSPKSAAEDATPLCLNLPALGGSTWKTWALFKLAKERLGGPKQQPSLTQTFTRNKGPRAPSRCVAGQRHHQVQGRVWLDMRDLLFSLRMNNHGNRVSREVPQSWCLWWPDRKELPGVSSVPALLE